MKNAIVTDKQFNHIYYKYKKELINGELTDVQNRDGFLFDENFNVTDIKAENLPKHFIYGIYEYGCGYLDSHDVKGLKYIHSDLGGFMENDVLLVSYCNEEFSSNEYDCLVKGTECLSFLKGVNRNSELDVFPIYRQLSEYKTAYINEHPDDHSVFYNLHLFVFGFPENYRKDKRYKGNEKMMRYAYETEVMRKKK